MPTPYRYTAPVKKGAATGVVAAVYAQIERDFVLADGPLMSLSPVPNLLAATWAVVREAEVVGKAPRGNREVLAAAVSATNRCTFCVDAHSTLVHATGAHGLAEEVWSGGTPRDPELAKIVAWARSTGGPAPEPPAFSSELAPEYFGTALVTHFINRMVSALLNESLLPGGLQRLYLTRRIGGAAFRAVVRREPHPGESLNLLADRPKKGGPAWAAGTPVGLAFAALQAAAAEGGELLSAPARGVVERSIAAWDGTPLPLDAGWAGDVVACLPQAERAAARIALLAGLAPHRITDADVAVWRSGETTDADLVRLLGFGAMAAVRRIEGSICAASGVAH